MIEFDLSTVYGVVVFVTRLESVAITILGAYGASRHFKYYLETRKNCRGYMTRGEYVVCRHYLRHEWSRMVSKFCWFLIGIYLLTIPMPILPSIYGPYGPLFLRSILLGIEILWSWEGTKSRQDQEELTRLPQVTGGLKSHHEGESHVRT